MELIFRKTPAAGTQAPPGNHGPAFPGDKYGEPLANRELTVSTTLGRNLK